MSESKVEFAKVDPINFLVEFWENCEKSEYYESDFGELPPEEGLTNEDCWDAAHIQNFDPLHLPKTELTNILTCRDKGPASYGGVVVVPVSVVGGEGDGAELRHVFGLFRMYDNTRVYSTPLAYVKISGYYSSYSDNSYNPPDEWEVVNPQPKTIVDWVKV